MQRYIFIIFFVIMNSCLWAQELQMEVAVNFPQATNSQKSDLENLENELRDFINGTKWTEMDVFDNEKIKGSISIVVLEATDEINYTAEMFISAVRPVYGSTYNTPILNYKDNNFQFTYENGVQPRNVNGSSFVDNLSAVLTSYAYLIIGLDAASFSPKGGQKYFNILREIQNTIPLQYKNSKGSGWYSGGNSYNRSQFIAELIDTRFTRYHDVWYQYHLRGLDRMHEDVTKGKNAIIASLDILIQLMDEQSRSMITQTFFDCKTEELIEIFTEGDMEERKEVFEKLVKLSPTNRSKFIRITRR